MSAVKSLTNVVRFLVRGGKLTPKQGEEIKHLVNLNREKLRFELQHSKFTGKTFEKYDDNKPNVIAHINGLGDINKIELHPTIANLPEHRKNSFIVAAVNNALKKPKELVNARMKILNDEAVSSLYLALENYKRGDDVYVEDPFLKETTDALHLDTLFTNALYEAALDESFKPDGYLHEDEELLGQGKEKKELSEEEIDDIISGEAPLPSQTVIKHLYSKLDEMK
ncbi:hypothetical protein ABK040_004097 [Willaertia magna]